MELTPFEKIEPMKAGESAKKVLSTG